jgi:hypothetical protein
LRKQAEDLPVRLVLRAGRLLERSHAQVHYLRISPFGLGRCVSSYELMHGTPPYWFQAQGIPKPALPQPAGTIA